MISISISFWWVSIIVVAVVQLAKWALSKWADKITPFLPYAIFVILLIVYLIVSKDIGTACLNALLLTALSVYIYDIIKPIIRFIQSKIKKG